MACGLQRILLAQRGKFVAGMAAVTLRESGRWEARVRRVGGKSISRTFATKQAASAWARAQEAAIERGTWVDTAAARRILLRDLIEDYVASVASKRDSATELARLRRFQEELGHLRLDGVTPAVILEWRDRRGLAVSPATVAREMGVLGSVFTWGRKERLLPIPQNPVQAVSKPTANVARDRRLVADEEERLLAAMQDGCAAHQGPRRAGNYRVGSRQPLLRPVFQLALETAMRQGELLALQWRHVDLVARTVHLPRTKNGEPRTVPLSRKAAAILASLREDGPNPGVTEGRVFGLTADALKKAWTRALARARATYEDECFRLGARPDERLIDLRFHDLRHEAASRLANKLPNLIELAAVTGHKDLRMLKRYYHPKASELALKLD